LLEELKAFERKDPLLCNKFLQFGRNIISQTYVQLRVIKP